MPEPSVQVEGSPHPRLPALNSLLPTGPLLPKRRTAIGSGPLAGVNMRSGPTRANPVIGVAQKGERLRVAYRDRDWVEVIEPDSGKRGWVYGRFVQASPQGAPSP